MIGLSIWPLDQTLTGITDPGQSGPEVNGNEGLLHMSQTKTIAPPSDAVYWHTQDSI